MPCASVAQLVERGRDLLACAHAPGALRSSAAGDRERDQALLRAIVEVALEAPALGVADLDDPRRATRVSSASSARSVAREEACSSASPAARAAAVEAHARDAPAWRSCAITFGAPRHIGHDAARLGRAQRRPSSSTTRLACGYTTDRSASPALAASATRSASDGGRAPTTTPAMR